MAATFTLFLKGTSMRHVLNRNDYEDLYGPQAYPKGTSAAASELVTRGLKANASTLDYLASKGVVAVPQTDGGRRLWERRHIDQELFAKKHTELRDRLASIKLQLDVLDRSHDETAELAAKVSELSQTLKEQWFIADYATKRRLLEIVCLNSVLDGATLCPEMRKPFDVLAEGLLLKNSRGDRI